MQQRKLGTVTVVSGNKLPISIERGTDDCAIKQHGVISNIHHRRDTVVTLNGRMRRESFCRSETPGTWNLGAHAKKNTEEKVDGE